MKKTMLSLGLIVVLLVLPLCGCNQIAEQAEISPWDPPIQGLEWGMSQEEAITVLQCEGSYEVIEKDGATILTIPDGYVSVYGVELKGLSLQFMTDDSGIPGYEGLFTFSGTCEDEEVESLQAKLNETYADFRKTDDFSDTQCWESPAIKDLDNAQEIESALTEKLAQTIPDDSMVQKIQIATVASPLVKYQLFLTGETRGWLLVEAKYQVLYNAVKP